MTFYVIHDLSFDVTFEKSLKMMTKEALALKNVKEDHGLHSSVDASYAISGAKKSQT